MLWKNPNVFFYNLWLCKQYIKLIPTCSMFEFPVLMLKRSVLFTFVRFVSSVETLISVGVDLCVDVCWNPPQNTFASRSQVVNFEWRIPLWKKMSVHLYHKQRVSRHCSALVNSNGLSAISSAPEIRAGCKSSWSNTVQANRKHRRVGNVNASTLRMGPRGVEHLNTRKPPLCPFRWSPWNLAVRVLLAASFSVYVLNFCPLFGAWNNLFLQIPRSSTFIHETPVFMGSERNRILPWTHHCRSGEFHLLCWFHIREWRKQPKLAARGHWLAENDARPQSTVRFCNLPGLNQTHTTQRCISVLFFLAFFHSYQRFCAFVGMPD